jgi:hypothetical protein
MYQLEHDALFNAIREGKVINDGERMMLSTLVGIMGREAAYTGQRIVWADEPVPAAPAVKPDAGDKKPAKPVEPPPSMAITSSKQDLAPDNLKWEDNFDAGQTPRPGMTKFV